MKSYQAGEGVGVTSLAVGTAIRGKQWNGLATIMNAARAKTWTQNISDHLWQELQKLLESYTWDREAEAETKRLEMKAVARSREASMLWKGAKAFS